MLIVGIIGTVASIGTGIYASQSNEQNVEETNETNYRIARETNQANIEQANLAYQRALPLNQVRNLMSAGLSRQGALLSLTGQSGYQMPTLQGAQMQAPQKNLLGLDNAMQRLEGIPSGVEQMRLVQEQRDALATDTQIKLNEDARKQEMHQYDMWTKLYGKDATVKLDNVSNKIVSLAAAKGINLDKIDTIDKLIKEFNLDKDKDWSTMPHYARQQILDGVRAQAAENRAQQAALDAHSAAVDKHEESKTNLEIARRRDKREEQAAKDAHMKALDDLKNSEFGRTLQHYQIEKLQADTADSWNKVEQWHEETNLREKERIARELQADYQRIMQNFNIAKSDFMNSQFYYIDSDGNIQLTALGKDKKGMKEAWDFAGTFFGVDLLKDILSGLVTLSPVK